MSVRTIRLELARNPDFPEGSSNHGYEFRAPLTEDGSLDHDTWQKVKADCSVHRFWKGEPDEEGHLIHTRGRRWLFSYEDGEEDDEPIFKFDRHHFVEGEYVSITEHDGVQRTFQVVAVK